MARKINPNIIRIPFLKTWPSLWHSEVNYADLFLQDAFIRKYFRVQFRQYRIDVFKCLIKRTFNSAYITVFLFNANSRANLQFKPFLFLRSFKLFRTLLDMEANRFNVTLRRLTKLPNVLVQFRFIRYQKPNLLNIVLTANPILLANYFFRRYKKMNSYRYILKSFRKIYTVAHKFKFNLKGLQLRVAGPVRAPRTRRSQIIKKIFFGTTPVQTFANLVLFSVKTRRLSEGVVTLKLWFFKRLNRSDLLNRHNLLTDLHRIVSRYRRIQKYPRYSKNGLMQVWRVYIPKMNKIYYRRYNQMGYYNFPKPKRYNQRSPRRMRR